MLSHDNKATNSLFLFFLRFAAEVKVFPDRYSLDVVQMNLGREEPLGFVGRLGVNVPRRRDPEAPLAKARN